MTVLTWRDVAAPDFRGVQDGIQNFSNMLNSGLGAARAGLAKVEGDQNDAANNALMAEIAGTQNEDAAKSLLASLTSRPDIARISGDTLKAAMARPAELLEYASANSDLNFTNYTRDKVKASDAAQKMANPILQQAGLLASSGKMDEAFKTLADHPDALGGLTPDQFFASLKDVQGTVTGDTGMRSGRHGYDTNVRDDHDNQDAIGLLNTYRSEGLTQEDYSSWFENNRERLLREGHSAPALEKFRAMLMGDAPADASFGGGAAPGGGGSISFGEMATPENASAIVSAARSLGTTPEDLATVISYETGGKFDPNVVGGKNNNYMGLIQFGPEERAKYGVKAGMTFQQQMGAVVSYLKDRGFKPGMDIKDLYSTINAGSPGLYNASDGNGTVNSHVAEMLASHRNNASAFIARAAQDFQGQFGPTYNSSQDSGQSFARGMIDAMNSDANPRTVAMGLVGKDGILAGENLGNVTGAIKQIQQRSKNKISPAAAALILSKSVDANKNWYQRAGDRLKGIIGGGDGLTSHIDWDQADQLINLASNRDALQKQATASVANSASAQLVASSSAAQTAAEAAAAAKARRAIALGRKPNVGQALADAVGAGQNHSDALVNSAGITAAGGNQPAPPPRLNQRNVPRSAPKVFRPNPNNRMEMLLLQSLNSRK